MVRISYPRAALATLLAASTLTAGCSPTDQPVRGSASNPEAPTISTSASQAAPQPQPQPTFPTGSRGRRGGSGAGSRAASGGLPADWPSDLPLPPGEVVGSSGSAGRWSVLILAAGSAADARQSTLAFYTRTGFTAVSDSVLNKGKRQITLVVENRDHSATHTNLVIGVTTQ